MAETKPVFTYVSIDYLRTRSTQIFNKTIEWVLIENFIPIDIFVDTRCEQRCSVSWDLDWVVIL